MRQQTLDISGRDENTRGNSAFRSRAGVFFLKAVTLCSLTLRVELRFL